MLDRRIAFGGDVIPALVASAPKIVGATRKMTVTSIPGTNREVVDMEDAWEPYDQPFTLFVGDGSIDSIQEVMREVAQKLYKTGWQTLVDDYNPEYFRLAYYQGPFDVENRYTRAGKFDVSFKCRAEWFLKTGNYAVDVTNGSKLHNPTANIAKPLIHVEGSGNGTLTIAGKTATIKGMVDYLNIDCDIQDVYRLSSENKNSCLEGDFPVLYPGDNAVAFTGDISAVSIVPRYWVL